MFTFCEKNELFGLYSDLWISDDFCGIAKIYADRFSEPAEKTHQITFKHKFQGIDTTPLTKKDCTPHYR